MQQLPRKRFRWNNTQYHRNTDSVSGHAIIQGLGGAATGTTVIGVNASYGASAAGGASSITNGYGINVVGGNVSSGGTIANNAGVLYKNNLQPLTIPTFSSAQALFRQANSVSTIAQQITIYSPVI